MVGIGKCYPLYCNCQIQMSQTPQLPLSTGQKTTFFKTRLENQALALCSPWALLSNWRVLLKMLHLHWKINATLHPSVRFSKTQMTQASQTEPFCEVLAWFSRVIAFVFKPFYFEASNHYMNPYYLLYIFMLFHTYMET